MPRPDTHTAPKTIRPDPTAGYNPQAEAKSKLKARRARRLASLIRQVRKTNNRIRAHQQGSTQISAQIQQEWGAILRAQGYGHSWIHWILAFVEAISHVPQHCPTIAWLEDACQLTKFDADAYIRQEQNLRRQRRRHSLEFARAHTNNANAYRIIRGKEQRFLHDVLTVASATATICRSIRGATVFRLDGPLRLPVGAQISLDQATAVVQQSQDTNLKVHQISAPINTRRSLKWHTHAYTVAQMSNAFHSYWSQFWQRDSDFEQISDSPWQDLFDEIDQLIPHHGTMILSDSAHPPRGRNPTKQQGLTVGAQKNYSGSHQVWSKTFLTC